MTKILIVDDDDCNRTILEELLEDHYEVKSVASGIEGLNIVQSFVPDLILLDVLMPNMDGYTVAKKLRAMNVPFPPIIFVTALRDEEAIKKSFDSGGVDYITKPFLAIEIMSRIRTHTQLARLITDLDKEVEKKTYELSKLNNSFVLALEKANFYNDNDTGNHIKRVSAYSHLLAQHYGCSKQKSEDILNYASLHDIGKVAIPGEILRKPARLTHEEFDIIKTHSYQGFKIIDNDGIPDVAKNIVRYHHEKWDGSGYPDGLEGTNIPVEARVVALADVFDALTNKRVYKGAFSLEKSLQIIHESAGSHFEPKLVQVFDSVLDELLQIQKTFSD